MFLLIGLSFPLSYLWILNGSNEHFLPHRPTDAEARIVKIRANGFIVFVPKYVNYVLFYCNHMHGLQFFKISAKFCPKFLFLQLGITKLLDELNFSLSPKFRRSFRDIREIGKFVNINNEAQCFKENLESFKHNL